jgi:hypothetical protein
LNRGFNNIRYIATAYLKKEEVYRKIQEEASNRGLMFKEIGRGKGVEYGFIISDQSSKTYGNILGNAIEGENIYQAITKTLCDLYESNNSRNFVIVVDTIEHHFLVIPYEILKPVMYDRRSEDSIHKVLT